VGGFWFYYNYPKASAKITKAILIWLIVSLFIGYIYNPFLSPVHSTNEFSTLTGQLLLKPSMGTRNDSICISLQLKEYPQIVFQYRNPSCETISAESFIEGVQIGDTLSINVSKNDISNKAKYIYFTDLVYHSKNYFTSEAKKDESEDYTFFWTFILVTVFIILAVYLILDQTGTIDRIKAKYFTETRTELTSLKDFNEFPD
jgi:hypothetical protein